MIFVLYLLIIQATTWVLVSLDTFSNSLWVGVAKAALFGGFLHINVTRKLTAEHSMWWQQLSLRYFSTPTLSCTFTVHVFINRTSSNVTLDNKTFLLTPSCLSQGYASPWLTFPSLYNNNLLVKFLVLFLPYYWSIFRSLCLFKQAQGLNIWARVPKIAPQNSGFLLISEEKSGVLMLKDKYHMSPWFLHVRVFVSRVHNSS